MTRFYIILFAYITLLVSPALAAVVDGESKLNQGTTKYMDFFTGNYKGAVSTENSKAKKQHPLCGFLSQDPKVFTQAKNKLDLKKFLNGSLQSWGVACDSSGRVKEHFYIESTGAWSGNRGTVQREFFYESGKIDSNIWYYDFKDDNNFNLTGSNIIKTGSGMQEASNANLQYTLRTKVGIINMTLNMNDTWYMIDENTAVIRLLVKKFGMVFSEGLVVIQKAGK